MSSGAGGALMQETAQSPVPLLREPQRLTYLQQVVKDTLKSRAARIGLVWVGFAALMACFAPFIANSHPILMKAGGKWSSPLLRSLAPADVVLPVMFITAAGWLLTRRLSAVQGLVLVGWSGTIMALAAAPANLGGYGGYFDTVQRMFGTVFSGALLTLLGLVLVAFALWAPLRVIPGRALRWTALLVTPLAVLLLIFPVRPPANVVYEHFRDMQRAGKIQFALHTLIPYSANDRLRDHPEESLRPPRPGHWMGTDLNGADVASRMIHASRIALSIGFIATGIAVVIGITIGGLMGYFAGALDLFGMRLIEIFEAIPSLVLLVAITTFYGRSLYLMMTVIGLLSWTGNARFIRAEFLRLRKQDFVQAAVALGLPLRRVIFRHMLPNGVAPVLVSASFGVASAILLESVLSFLGLGLVDEPSWGQMLNQAREGMGFTWWMATFPGMAIFLTVFAYNLVGESLRDALDPKLRA